MLVSLQNLAKTCARPHSELGHTCTVVHELKHPSQQKHTIQLIRESALFVCFYDGPNLPFGIEFFSDSDNHSLRRGADECTLKKN